MRRSKALTVVIPAAGKGLRLARTQAADLHGVPKALLEVGRRPLLVELLRRAERWLGPSVREYRVVTGGDRGRTAAFLRRYFAGDPLLRKLRFRRQRRPSGPLAAVLAAGPVKGPLLIWLADTLRLAPEGRLRADSVYVAPVTGRLDRWCLAVGGKDGALRGLVDKPGAGGPRRGLALIGLYSLSDGALFRAVSRRVVAARRRLKGEFQLSSGLLEYHRVRPLRLETCGDWRDGGAPDTFLKTKERLLERLSAHRITLEPDMVLKTAPGRASELRREAAWYAAMRRINPSAAAAVSAEVRLRGGRLMMPYRDWPSLADWYLYRSLYLPAASERTFAGFLEFVATKLHRRVPLPPGAAAANARMLIDKTLARVARHPRRALLRARPSLNGRRLPSWSEAERKLRRLAAELGAPGPADWRTIHGDLVFSNVLADGAGGLFLVDPRGSYGGRDGVEGDRCYDWAKVAQCALFRYDCLKKDEFTLARSGGRFTLRFPLAEAPARRRWETLLARRLREEGVDERRVRFISATLLLGLLPLHEEPAQTDAAYLQALAALESL